jgi:hypothetical protein
MPRLTKLVATLTAVAFSTVSLAQTAPPPPPADENPPQQEAQGKFVWGVLLKLAAPHVFDFLANWVKKKIENRLDDRQSQTLAAGRAAAPIVNLGGYLCGKDIVLSSVSAGAAPNAMVGEPEAPLVVGKDGENYQGVNVALVGVDEHGTPTGLRTVADGFTTGERFKLRVLSTFDAVVVLGNITPRGIMRQIYPPEPGRAVSIPAGEEVLLPLGQHDYLQFAGDVGLDQLTITVRAPCSMQAGSASTAQVFRKDAPYGSDFVQQVKPGQYPVIAESIAINHK